MMRPLAAVVAACLIGSLAAAMPSTSIPAEAASKNIAAKALLSRLSIRSEDHSKKYDRVNFGNNEIDADGDGCSTRKEVLIRDAIKVKRISPSCAVSGEWKSPYDGKVSTNPNALEVDHLVPLAEAWFSGARKWSAKKRVAFGNDLGYKWDLQAVSKKQNQLKGAGDPADWLPKKNRCNYVTAWIGVKYRWNLSVDSREKAVLNRYLTMCGSPKVLKPGTPDVANLVDRPSDPTPAVPVATPSNTVTPVPVASTPAAAAPVASTPAAPAPVISTPAAPTPVASATFTCPSGTVFGDLTSITLNSTKSSAYYVYYDASGFVRNDSNASINIGSNPPAITFYTASGSQVGFHYGDWDLSNLATADYGGYILPPGATATWHALNSIESRSDWDSISVATANAVSPFGADWTNSDQRYKCPSANQSSDSRTRFTVTH